MGAFYGNKILKGETSPHTGKPWSLKDVPAYWREKTEKWLVKEKE